MKAIGRNDYVRYILNLRGEIYSLIDEHRPVQSGDGVHRKLVQVPRLVDELVAYIQDGNHRTIEELCTDAELELKHHHKMVTAIHDIDVAVKEKITGADELRSVREKIRTLLLILFKKQ